MERKTGGSLIRLFIVMNAVARPLALVFPRFHWTLFRLVNAEHRRRQATIDLIHASPYLLRDIGATEDHFSERHK